jgi:hypothetical protein
MNVKIVVLSYNPIFKKGIVRMTLKENGTIEIRQLSQEDIDSNLQEERSIDILYLPLAFTKKGRKGYNNPERSDPVYQEALLYKDTADYFLEFLGKKRSGTFKIIDIVTEDFKDQLQKVIWILCACNLKKKREVLLSKGVSEDNFMWFGDNHIQCKEIIIIKGWVWELAQGILERLS